jgi:hypothetical protein
MPSPQAKQPSAERVRPNPYMQVEAALLLALCIFLGFVLPLLLRSSFEGVWFKTSGDKNAPAEMKILMHHGKFAEILPVGCLNGDSYETITLIADGREHTWSEPAACTIKPGINSYSAQLTSNAFQLIKRTDSATLTESWNLVGHGRMVMSKDGRTATYQRASWLRSLFTEEP